VRSYAWHPRFSTSFGNPALGISIYSPRGSPLSFFSTAEGLPRSTPAILDHLPDLSFTISPPKLDVGSYSQGHLAHQLCYFSVWILVLLAVIPLMSQNPNLPTQRVLLETTFRITLTKSTNYHPLLKITIFDSNGHLWAPNFHHSLTACGEILRTGLVQLGSNKLPPAYL